MLEDGSVSLGKAAQIAGYSERTFAEILRERKIPSIRYENIDLEKELKNAWPRNFEYLVLDCSWNINQIKLLDDLYQELIIPTAVKEEFGSPQINNQTLVTVSLSLAELLEQELNLGPGESQVLALAKKDNLTAVLDDQKARSIAARLGVDFTGTLGILLKAEKHNAINSAANEAKKLKKEGFYISQKLISQLKRLP